MSKIDFFEGLLFFLHASEKLKNEHRNEFTSSGRRESVAEHCWRVTLMVLVMYRDLETTVDPLKCLKMALVHDLPEIVTGDIENKKDLEAKFKSEKKALKSILEPLTPGLRKELFSIWEEFEEQQSPEAKFVLALDKLEAHMQQNESDVRNWSDWKKNAALFFTQKYCDWDPFLTNFQEEIRKESEELLKKLKNNENF